MIKKIYLLIIIMAAMFNVIGCADSYKTNLKNVETKDYFQIQPNTKEINEIVDICENYFNSGDGNISLGNLDSVKKLMDLLGENNFISIDSKNQVNMTNWEYVTDFCEDVENNENSTLIITEIAYDNCFYIYFFKCLDSNVYVTKKSYEYLNGSAKNIGEITYTVKEWKYTDEGYLMFSGDWFSKDLYLLTLSSAEEYIAFRVMPLDNKCRELNNKYVSPIGYERNNMFIVDWNEHDFGALNFYDLFDVFFYVINGKDVPYKADKNLGVGAVYKIPEHEFENVIMTFLNIDKETLRSKTIYNWEDNTYEYKPRGFYDAGYSSCPYPEVVDYKENNDNTITLTVNVVFPHKGTSKVFSHEVVICPVENEGVKYISNRIIHSENDYEETWYKPRLTEKQWKEIYGN